MRSFLNKAVLVVGMACAPSLLHAQNQSQTPSVDYGRTTVLLSSDFVNSIQGLGVVITDLNNNVLQNNSFTLRAVAGSVDLTSSEGEVEHKGGLMINAAGNVLRIQDLTIDTSNPSAPVITAEFINNDHFAGRMALFTIQPPPAFTLPLTVQGGVLEENGLGLSLAPAAASALSNLFDTQVQAGISIGTANAYIVFAAQN